MTNVQNETSTETVNMTALSAEGVTPEAVTVGPEALLAKVKKAIDANSAAEARGRKALAAMVATFVEMGELYVADPAITKALDDKCKEHGLTPVSVETTTNLFLPLVRMISGEWKEVVSKGKPVKNKDGSAKMQWYPNRSFEKYASVIRFFVHNEISSATVVDTLMGDKGIEVGLEEAVAPTVSAIVAADGEQHGTKRTPTIWTDDLRKKAAGLREITSVEITPALETALQFNADDYAAVIVRKRGGRLEILGDAAGEVDALNRLVKRRAEKLEEFLKANGSLFEAVPANAE